MATQPVAPFRLLGVLYFLPVCTPIILAMIVVLRVGSRRETLFVCARSFTLCPYSVDSKAELLTE